MPPSIAVKPLNVIVPDACAIQLAKSEAREPVAEAGSIWVLPLGRRQRSFAGIEGVISGRQVVVRAKDLMTEIAAKFEGMRSRGPRCADPVDAQLSSMKGALLIPNWGTF